MKRITGIILAAGQGTRMMPLTLETPKPLLKIYPGGDLIHYNMQRLHLLVGEYMVVVHYHADSIMSALGHEIDNTPIRYAYQSLQAGTMNAFRTALEELEGDTKHHDGYIISNTDDIIDIGMYKKLQEHIHDNPSQPAICIQKIDDPISKTELGMVAINNQGKFVEIHEKVADINLEFANVGMYYIPSELCKNMPMFSMHSTEEYITDFVNYLAQNHDIALIRSFGPWLRCTSPKDYVKIRSYFGMSTHLSNY